MPSRDRTIEHPDDPEVGLLSRAAAGDEDAVTDLYGIYGPPLYGFGLRRLGDPMLAEELVQTVLTRLWHRAARYEPTRGSVRTWVFSIARNAVVDLHRRRPAAIPADPLPEPTALVDELEQLVRAEAVRAALDRLTPEHREVLQLAYVQGLTQRDIATRLEVPLGTVKSRTFYALKALRLACDELGVAP